MSDREPAHPATPAEVTDIVTGIVLHRRAGTAWKVAFAVSCALTALLAASIAVLLVRGVGVWGIAMPVAWGFAITNYVWWIGIGMAGTFISAALYLTRQGWRSALNRFAEAMTVFALAVSALFPVLHLGRPWFSYWLAPYPDRMGLWPQWRSALVWDFFAIGAYVVVSLLYFYVGLVPDLAAVRDRARRRGQQVFYGLLALGWRGEAREWERHATLTKILAGLAVPLVFSVHSMVALDFSEGLLPGWHSTLFPPFFVAGALFSGTAMVIVLAVPLRRAYALGDFITDGHLDKLARLMLAAGLVVTYGYAAEAFTAYYGGDPQELAVQSNRLHGAYAWLYGLTIACNSVAIQALWWPRVRRSTPALLVIAALVLAGMWMERFMLIVTSLYRDYLPSSWGMFYPTWWDAAFLAGSIGLFALLFLLFVRLMPVLSIVELRRHAAELVDRRA
ncbi:NrfD/PsrC family molybdoenzyme membrane anchor subunit [Luteibacter sp. 329MFSha]|uniref:NrfD/PsrC family molybdoenzyme membrane anchor subunit n=1 Tax=Luteibacter sp. 329MFSha TaxID=1798239 RepID=UPI0008BB5318|nr:NrfD/PsrC family molybdoenzyme membrane anchor subunit [Luteibacter sp. 329MFSha]SEV85002.1 quinol:cytochrome c oxidoreductase quinone-binding subunit 1 [Luteibacter sp. 329MFSha]